MTKKQQLAELQLRIDLRPGSYNDNASPTKNDTNWTSKMTSKAFNFYLSLPVNPLWIVSALWFNKS